MAEFHNAECPLQALLNVVIVNVVMVNVIMLSVVTLADNAYQEQPRVFIFQIHFRLVLNLRVK